MEKVLLVLFLFFWAGSRALSATVSKEIPAWARGYQAPLVFTVSADRVINGFPAPGLSYGTIDPTAPTVPEESNGVNYQAYKSEFRRFRIGNRQILETLAAGGILPGDSIRGWRLVIVYSFAMTSAPYAVHADYPPIYLGDLLTFKMLESQVTRVGRVSSSFSEEVTYGGYTQINRCKVAMEFALPEPSPQKLTFRFSALGLTWEKAYYDNRIVPYEWGYIRVWKPIEFCSELMSGHLLLDHPDTRFSERMLARLAFSQGALRRVSDLRIEFPELVDPAWTPWHKLADTTAYDSSVLQD